MMDVNFGGLSERRRGVGWGKETSHEMGVEAFLLL